ncbi:RAMP superfamily CRISPR-associated protein [Kerstersia gyiorum]|uniref:RAMP superfamily CRISPR-associated protein n=1 Tax=Kerstersia gyiorum TaxID=206506 RepID=UPI003B42CE61
MKILRYRLDFQTPAFLGNARQQAQWRTPPLKALLRQWWRVAYAANRQYHVDIKTMRQQEAELFGSANDDLVNKSKLRLRLSHWNEGNPQVPWPQFAAVRHPEVNRPISADLYLGYGPVMLPKGSNRPTLKANAALQPTDHALLSLACPEESAPLIEQALYCIDQFAAVGGRSRNGWGSLHLAPLEGTAPLQGTIPLRDWQQALMLDWPHAIGQDQQGALIWQTQPFNDWKSLMESLAHLKIGLRTQFRLTTGKNALHSEDRHWLSYPITNHSVKEWGGNARLPNSLRFKIRPSPTHPSQCVGVIFHMPCLPPPAFRPEASTIIRVWQRVHPFLDDPAQELDRISA